MGGSRPVLMRAGGVAVLLDTAGAALPRILHFGADPGPLDGPAAARLVGDLVPAVANSALDEPWLLPLLPGEPDGWSGRPGLAGHREGRDVFARLDVRTIEPDGERGLTARGADDLAGISTTSELRLEPSGVLRVRHEATNTGSGTYTLTGLNAVLPIPAQATELQDLTGRWCRERSPQRRPFQHGTHARESRRGRTGHDSALLLTVGTPGFGFRSGQVWAVHVAWSGNHVHLAERLPEGAGAGGVGVLGGGELLLPGEVRLAPGETYATPWIFFVWSDEGLDGASARLHRYLRARPAHPTRPRPLVLNTWEAVYFNHDLDRLTALAEQGAAIGVERFVVDDGWFMGRRDDTRGLGDWYVDPVAYPEGLRPLADRVRELGMEFGLWVEAEMVNPDSELARRHPDWLLASPGRLPRLFRQQVVLDVAHPQAFEYLLERLDSLVGENGVDYLKWDHNRDLHESVHAGGAGVHAQTLAVYALMDQLRSRHPGLEIESCSAGGARVDLGILEHADRIWASDTNDALERQAIQRWTGVLLPPELVGCHVGPPVSHTTGRVSDLSFRCVTALFGHAGLEWDLTSVTPDELAGLTRWSALYRELRHLLHSGETVRADHPDPGAWVHGVVAGDGSEAVFCYVRLGTSADVLPNRFWLPGLDPDRLYRLRVRDETGLPHGCGRRSPSWWQAGGTQARGAVLERIGLPAPLLNPGEAIVLHLTTAATEAPS